MRCVVLILLTHYSDEEETLDTQMSSNNEHVLGYWDIKGLAAPIRMAFAFGGIPYRDEMYSLSQVDGKWRSAWPAKAKEMLASGDSAFPNLPFLLIPNAEGSNGKGLCVMQSGAILRYVAQLGGIMGDGPQEALRADELLEQTMDLRNEMTRLVYGADFQAKHESFCQQTLPYYFGAFEKYLATRYGVDAAGAPTDGGLYLVGSRVSVADLAVKDALDTAAQLAGALLDVSTLYPLTTQHRAFVGALPQLKAYYEGPLAKLAPNNKIAYWGSTPTQ
jgi:glutathione S-transferase